MMNDIIFSAFQVAKDWHPFIKALAEGCVMKELICKAGKVGMVGTAGVGAMRGANIHLFHWIMMMTITMVFLGAVAVAASRPADIGAEDLLFGGRHGAIFFFYFFLNWIWNIFGFWLCKFVSKFVL